MKNLKGFFNRNSSTILTVMGSTGVILTSILSIKATPKALKIIEEVKKEKDEKKLSMVETVKVAWKPYIPAIISGATTISCIVGSNYINKKTQESLLSAYLLLDNYRKKCHMKSVDRSIENRVIASKYDKNTKLDASKELFFDYQSMRYFQSTFDELEKVKSILNDKLINDGFVCLNDMYDILHMKHVPYGYQLGWGAMENQKIGYGLDFVYENTVLDDGLECNIFTIVTDPSIVYIS